MELFEYSFEHLWPGKRFHIMDTKTLISTTSSPDDGHTFVEVERWDNNVPVLRSGRRGVLHADTAKQVLPPAQSAFKSQVGGGHYKDMAIQPFEFSMANKLDPMQHTIVKYVTRFRAKNGVEDLKKARHTLDLLIEWEEQHA